MRTPLRYLLPVLMLAGCLQAQQQPFTPEWDIRAVLKEISAHSLRLVKALDKVDANAWVQKGAPDTYVAQWKSARAQAQAVAGDATELAQNPEKLSLALQTFFRMQSIEFMIGSLTGGIRRYQAPAVADEVSATAAENGANRERFQKFIVELATQREQEYQIMDHEAQRCRALISRESPPARKTGRKQSQ